MAQSFDPNSLNIQTEPILDTLMQWVTCESPTIDPAAVNRMQDIAAADLVCAGATVQRVPGRPGQPDSVLASFPHTKADEPGILIMGHLDTVQPVGTLEKLPCRVEGNLCYGPGINDMKAGDVLSLWAVRALIAAGVTTPLPIRVLFTGDEEIGSPWTRALIESTALRHKYILIPEPAEPNGGVVTGRHEICRFRLKSHGTPTHAGATPEKGRSAIHQMAEKILAIESLSSPEMTLSVGIVHGGLWSNCITTLCEAELLVQIREPARKAERLAALMALQHKDDMSSFVIEPSVVRPRWEPNDGSLMIHGVAKTIAAGLGLELPSVISGGGSDGNFTGALGIPTLCGLGARGADHHTLNEHIQIDSLVPRTRLMAGLLATLA